MLKHKNITTCAITLILIIFIANYYMNIPVWVYFLIIIIWLTITVIGAFHIRWNYFLQATLVLPQNNEKVVALTFDDGPHPQYTNSILQILKRYNAKATFFCIGKQVQKYPEIVKSIFNEGHLVANHTFSHSRTIDFYGTKRFIEEITQTDLEIEKILSEKPKYFRPPYGVTNPNIKKAVDSTGHKVIGWSIRSLDTTNMEANSIVKRIVKRISNRDIILLHDTQGKSVEVLEQLLTYLNENKYKTVALNEI